MQLGIGGRTVVATVSRTHCEVASDGGDDSIRRDFADQVVEIVRDKEIALAIERQPFGIIELREHGGLSVAGVTIPCRVVAGNSGDDTVGGDFADHTVAVVRDVHVARVVWKDSPRSCELRAEGWAAVTTVWSPLIVRVPDACKGINVLIQWSGWGGAGGG